MNDEINQEIANKTIAIAFQATKLTTETFTRALKAYIQHRKQKNSLRNETTHGKMKVNELVGQGQGASTIEISYKNIRSFEKVSKKYNVDYAVKKDKTVDPPRYLVFFKGKDTDVMAQAFKEFVKANERKKQRSSIREKLHEKQKFLENQKTQVNEKSKEKQRVKNRSREQSR